MREIALLSLLLAGASSLPAADPLMVDATTGASAAFARYIAGLDRAETWSPESIEIDASLPKLKKEGRLRAIRRAQPRSQPEYEVLEITGDRTVRRQVIERYLSAEITAAAIPSSSVAIVPANYKFHFAGTAQSGDKAVYIFQITPRKKRDGLIKGELWLDAESGAAVRQAGYLVKTPSIFVKRVAVTRETLLHNGVAALRLTHLSVDTRLAGPADLTIEERPYSASNQALSLSQPAMR